MRYVILALLVIQSRNFYLVFAANHDYLDHHFISPYPSASTLLSWFTIIPFQAFLLHSLWKLQTWQKLKVTVFDIVDCKKAGLSGIEQILYFKGTVQMQYVMLNCFEFFLFLVLENMHVNIQSRWKRPCWRCCWLPVFHFFQGPAHFGGLNFLKKG